MNSLYHAYQAYERRVIRGEFSRRSRKAPRQAFPAILVVQLGDVLIDAGLKLKHHAIGGKTMAWSAAAGSKR